MYDIGILEELLKRMSILEELQASLYLPTPSVAESQRPRKPFQKKKSGQIRIPYDQNALPDYRGRVIYASPSMRTKGFTHHNAFARIEVSQDNVPADLGDHLLFTAVLEGAAGSAWVELDQAQLFSTGRNGTFMVPLLAATSLALDIRFRLYAGDNATYPDPPPANPRLLRFQITGMLISGYEM